MPMGFAGLLGEGRGDGEKRASGLRERAVEGGEAQVVADGESEPSPWQGGGDADFARTVVARLAITFAIAELDIEHVDLVVARDDVALAVDQEGAVRRLFRQQLDGQRADMKEDAELARKLAKGGKRRVVFLGCDRREQPLTLDFQDVGHLGREHVIGTGALGLLDQSHRGIEIALWGEARAHLHETGGEARSLTCTHAGGLLSVPVSASGRPSNASSLPPRSSAER